MSVKRKSNWYIYLIAFGITIAFVVVAIFSFRWYLFPEQSESVGLTTSGDIEENFKPNSSHNFVMMTMLSDKAEDSPDLFIMYAYNAVNNEICLIPLPIGISIELNGRTLSNIYTAQGGDAVIKAVEEAIGVTCQSFVKMDRKGFIDFSTAFGNVEFNVDKTLVINDGDTVDTINAGEQLFSSDRLFGYIMKAEFDGGELNRYNYVCEILTEFINQNYRNIDSSLMDLLYNMAISDSDTDLSSEMYTSRKAALLNTIEYGNEPAVYYIPYGEYTDDGGFRISENSITSIKQRVGIQ